MGTRPGSLGRPGGPLGPAALACALLGAPASVAVARGHDEPREVVLAELGLTLTLPPLEGLAARGQNRWQGTLGKSQVEISLKTLPTEKYGFLEPEGVLDYGPSFWSNPEQGRNEPGARRALEGPFGYASYAAYERTQLVPRGGGEPVGLRYLLSGLLPDSGYWITLEASPPPSAEDEARLFEFLAKGILYAGEVRVHEWTDEEAEGRWMRDAPASTHDKFERPIRTAHYIILTNSSGGKKFAAKMEDCHEKILEVYPFDDVPGRRLLPVFLFRTSDEYFEFFANVAGISLEEARRSKGHAWRDYYATWYDAPGDPVHIHEATHQIFANRLGLGGGGSWFQEGVAEYMSSRRGDRSAAAGQVKKGRHVPLAEFVTIPSLLMSSDQDAARGDMAGDNYKQAALLIEFLRESKPMRDRFPEFLLRIGRVGRGERNEIEAVVEDLYGVDLEGLDELWIAYCKKR